MGLATVLGIVRECDGHIRLDSSPGKGTNFSILLPIAENDAREESDGSAHLKKGGTETILLVDDEAAICRVGARLLQNAGYTVITETDSERALALFARDPGRFATVITDMTMPKLSGDQLAREMIRLRADIPILLITGYSRQISLEMLDEIGIRGYMTKPFEERILLAKVRELIDETGKKR